MLGVRKRKWVVVGFVYCFGVSRWVQERMRSSARVDGCRAACAPMNESGCSLHPSGLKAASFDQPRRGMSVIAMKEPVVLLDASNYRIVCVIRAPALEKRFLHGFSKYSKHARRRNRVLGKDA